MGKSALFVLFISLFSVNCTFFQFEGEVTAEAKEPLIYIHNDTNRTIFFFAGDEDDGSRISIDLSDHSNWPSVKPGYTYALKYCELAWYDEGDTRAWIYWKTANGKYGSLRVTLPYE